ncbi:MAG: hypothetical protein JST01_13030 [Cyanobacteria bacterium SZAS TMP-1]|nr:hypothetical protein [Cyanobacteria bacterium SZAS TMP-1]
MTQTNTAPVSLYNSRQRAVSITLGLASSFSLSTSASIANGQMPSPPVAHPGWQAQQATSVTHTGSPFGHLSWGSASLNQGAQAATNTAGGFAQHSVTNFQSTYAPVHNPAATFHALAGAAQASAADLNLASIAKQFTAGNLANFKELTIQIGNTQQVVSTDTRLTAAEMVAAQQILTGGTQTLKISGNGAAIGGTVTLNNNLLTALDSTVGGSIGSLTIAHGVKVIDTMSQLSITGNLNNYGSLLTASTSRGASDSITATTIFNALGGSIGSYTGGGGLFAADPVLTGLNGIANAGTISSAGNLTLNAPVVYNIASTADNGAVTQASISAAHNVNINTQALNNAGVIAALTGNVNVASPAALAINNGGGAIDASHGNINVTAGGGDIALTGGNYYSKNLNLDAGSGNVDLNIGEVTGAVNASGSCVHVFADSSTLTLGDINATVDPMFTATNDLTIDGTIAPTNGAPLTLIAGGNILGGKGNKGLDTSSKTGAGGALTLIAGAAFTPLNPNPGVDPVTVTGVNGSGGSINLTGKNGSTAAVSTIKTSGSVAGDAGSITMVAFGNGTINTGAATLDASTKGTGKYGNVTLISGAVFVTSITTGKILSQDLTVSTATPGVGGGVVYNADGSLASGSYTAGALQNASVSLAPTGSVTSKGNVSITSGASASLGSVSATNTVNIQTKNDLVIGKAITGDTITVQSTSGSVAVNAAIGTTASTVVSVTGTHLSTGAGSVAGKSVTLTASDAIGIGSSSKYFVTKANALAANDTATGNPGASVYIQNTGDLILNNSSADSKSGTGFFLKQSGKLDVSGTLQARNVTLTSTKDMTISGTVNGSNITNINLTSAAFTLANTGQIGPKVLSTLTLNVNASGDTNLHGVLAVDGANFTTKGSFNTGATANLTIGSNGLNATAVGPISLAGKIVSSSFLGDSITTSAAVTISGDIALLGTVHGKTINVTSSGKFGNGGGFFVSGLTATGSGNAIIIDGAVTGGSADLTTTSSSGAVVINMGGTVHSDNQLDINTNNLVAHGIGSISIGNGSNGGLLQLQSTGNMVINADDGVFATGAAGGSMSIQGPFEKAVNLTINSPGNPFSTLPNLSDIGISFEHGTITSPLQGLVVHPDANGFSAVRIFATQMIYNGTAPFTTPFLISADGTTSKAGESIQDIQLFILGGDVNISNTGPTINTGGVVNTFKINAPGIDAAQVFLSSSGILRLEDPTTSFITVGTVTDPNKASHFIQAFGQIGVAIKGDFTTKNADGGYTDLQIITSSKVPFVIDSSQNFGTLVNGQTNVAAGEGLAGNLVTLINAPGVVVGPTNKIFGAEAIFTNANTITNNGTISTPSFVMGPTSGKVIVSNNGAITTPTTDLDIHTSSGSLTINNTSTASYSATGSFLLYSPNSSVTLTADKASTPIAPQAAKIDIEAILGTISLGTGSNQITVQSLGAGGNGGSIIIKAQNLLTGTAGTALQAETTVGGTTNGGSVDILLTGTKALTVGPTGLTIDIKNQGNNSGGEVTLTNNGLISIDTNNLDMSNVKANTTDLTINAKGLVYITKASTLSGFNLDHLSIASAATGAFLLGGAKVGTNGITETGAPLQANILSITNAGSIDATSAVPVAHDLSLTATKGQLIFASGKTLTATSDPTTGDGGIININAVGLTFTGGLTLSAAATNTGNGGDVAVNLTGTKTVTLDGTNLVIDVTNNSAQGGSVSVINGGAITADAATGLKLLGTNYGTGTGADLNLTAKGLLFVSNTQLLVAQPLHNVIFGSNNKTPFVLSGALPGGKSNGLSYANSTSTFSADNVSIINNGGTIDCTSSSGSIVAHNITLSAPTASILFDSGATLSASVDPATGNGGSISLTSKVVPWSNLGLNLDASGALTGAGGSISVSVTDTKALKVTTLSPVTLKMTAHAGPTGAVGGSLSLSNGGALTTDIPTSVFDYGSILTGAGLALKSGSVLAVNNVITYANAGLKTLSFTSNSKNAMLMSGAAPGTNGIQDPALTYTAGNITFSNTGGSVLKGSGAVSLQGTSSITLNALSDIGQSGTRIPIFSSGALNVSTGAKGNAYIDIANASTVAQANVGGKLDITATSADYSLGVNTPGNVVKAGSISFNLSDGNLNNTHTLSLGNISTTNGNLTVASAAQKLTILSNSLISSNNGNIYLQDLDTSKTNTPLISFQSGSVVHGVGPAKNLNQGQVFISIGPTPASNTLALGIKPANATINQIGFFNLFFGTFDNFSGSITVTDKTDILTAANRTLSFNTTKDYPATSITLAANVQITADPPPPAGTDYTTPFWNSLSNAPVKQMTVEAMSGLGTNLNNVAITSLPVSQNVQNHALINAPEFSAPVNTNTLSVLGGLSNSTVTSTINSRQFSPHPLTGVVSNTDGQLLESGAKLLAPDTQTRLNTPHGTVDIAAGAVVLIVSTDDYLSVFDLHDSHRQAVTVTSAGRRITLVPGRNIVFTDSNRTFGEINPAQFVGYRKVRHSSINESRKLIESEFEIMSLVRGLKPLQAMLTSDSARTRRTMCSMIKTAAILMNVSQSNEPFRLITAPQITACAVNPN